MDLWDQCEELALNSKGFKKADEFYRKNKKRLDAGAIVSWPAARPLLDLMKRRSKNHKKFDSEMQNDPTDSENATFSELVFWVHTSQWVYYGAVDPSLGKESTRNGDPSAILVGGWDLNNKRLDVVEASIALRKPNVIISRTIDFQREYNCALWVVEAVQFQEFFREILIEKSLEAKVPVPARPVTPHSDKDLRISSLEPYVTDGRIRFNQRHKLLLEQMRHHPKPDVKKDGPDALEMLWTLASRNSAGIPQIHSTGGHHRFRGYS
jgi:predicted phage terminase large subunit-like protein